jgi:L-rhamnonate dehydratase
MHTPRIVKAECAVLKGTRPRSAGCNARLPSHGSAVRVPLVRLTADDGATGFGFCAASEARLEEIVGQPLDALFDRASGVPEAWRAAEYPLWDLIARRQGTPVYRLAAAVNGRSSPNRLRVPCYDTSLYFDDLHLPSTEEAAARIAAEAEAGLASGHRAFKLKVGRGARHMDLHKGTERDIAVIRAVRQAVGPDCRLMIDANNGYNLNLAKQVLLATRDCDLFWIEEAFHEDAVLYRDLKEWQAASGLSVLIGDGEGEASGRLLDWAREGVVDVIQYDIFSHGFTRWLETGRKLDDLSPSRGAAGSVRAAPHHYGCYFGNYAACHLAPALAGFTFVEWDEATTPGIDAGAYSIADGQVHVPDLPGFGLALDESAFLAARTHVVDL